jgi:hypothetical protein
MKNVVSFPFYPDHAAPFDLGNGFSFRFASWAPDREIPANSERYRGIPDADRICIILSCRHGKESTVHLDRGEAYKEIFGDREWWTVLQEEPLTLEED